MRWVLHRLQERSKFREEHRKCKRCGLYFHVKYETCNVCAGLSDAQLESIIGKRRAFRMSLGNGMLAGTLVFLAGMILFAAI